MPSWGLVWAATLVLAASSAAGATPPTEFVWPCGKDFCTGPASNPVKQRFAGTNAFYLMLDHVTDADVGAFMRTTASKGANLIRFFAFTNGYGEGSVVMHSPAQPSLGAFNEAGLRRMDLILKEARDAGLRVVMPLVNFEPEMGGMAWYVEQVHGEGAPKELFYTDPAVKEAYWAWVSTVLGRTNALTGVAYVDDPTIFSVELANEPHTSNRYELDRGLPPGLMVKDWVWEMAGRVKGFPGFKAMVSTGEEGYRADGESASAHNVWINGGFKGVDFVGNTACPNVSFATIHVYPDNWEVAPGEYAWAGPNFIQDRARIAHALGKPIIMEEYGMKTGYLGDRDELYSFFHAQADLVGAGATLAWAVYAWPVNEGDGSYNFAWGSPGTAAMEEHFAKVGRANAAAVAAAAAAERPATVAAASASHRPSSPTHPSARAPSLPPLPCADVQPPSGGDCARQKAYGKCAASWMVAGGFCRATCGACGGGSGAPAPAPAPGASPLLPCTDVTPPGTATCSQQKAWGKCSADWMAAGGFCRATCGVCAGRGGGGGGGGGGAAAAAAPAPLLPHLPCDDVPPASGGTCAQQKQWLKCGADWMVANQWCARTCGRCGGDAAPAPSPAGERLAAPHRAAAPSPVAVATLHRAAAPSPAAVAAPHRAPVPAAAAAHQQHGGQKAGRITSPAAKPAAPAQTPKPTHPPPSTSALMEEDGGLDDVPGSSGSMAVAELPAAAAASTSASQAAWVAGTASPAVVDENDAPRSHADAPLPGEMAGLE